MQNVPMFSISLTLSQGQALGQFLLGRVGGTTSEFVV